MFLQLQTVVTDSELTETQGSRRQFLSLKPKLAISSKSMMIPGAPAAVTEDGSGVINKWTRDKGFIHFKLSEHPNPRDW